MPTRNQQLFLVSLLTLFLELLLIRWISTEIRVFAYINNLVLLACFMGIGLGSAYSRRKVSLLVSVAFVVVLALMVRSALFQDLTEALGAFEDSVVWSTAWREGSWAESIAALLMVLALFLGVVLCFLPLGHRIGELFDDHPSIVVAYSVNVLGSLAGVWLFAAISFFMMPPWGWIAVALAILLPLVPRTAVSLALFVALSIPALLVMAPSSEPGERTVWSPYQKLELRADPLRGTHARNYQVRVNNTGYMRLVDNSDAFFEENPRFDVEQREIQHYVLPYLLWPEARSILIAGAGGGNDAAAALRNGIESIDAVEIDPVIIDFGREVHPERPYQDPRVHVTIDDARSFFRRSGKRYDMVRIGLLDSHTQSSSLNNVRLDHYVYTEESLRQIRRLLEDDGMLSLSFWAERGWIVQKIQAMVTKVFERPPLVIRFTPNERVYGAGAYQFLVGTGNVDVHELFRSNADLAKRVARSPTAAVLNVRTGDAVEVPTDDWPYLYLQGREIPTIFLLVMLSLTLLLVPLSQLVRSQSGRFEWAFFFLGAGFLLLEFQNVSKGSLIFGATWMVNAYIFSAILLIVLLANLVVLRLGRVNVDVVFGLLAASLIALYLTPLDVFNDLPLALKSTAVVMLLNLPIFFAGILFVTFFQRVEDKRMAYGANLLGSACGGILESLSFITGIKALLLIVLVFYLASYLSGRRIQAAS